MNRNVREHTMTTATGRRGRHARPDRRIDPSVTRQDHRHSTDAQNTRYPLSAPIPAEQTSTPADAGPVRVRITRASIAADLATLQGHLAVVAGISPDQTPTVRMPAVRDSDNDALPVDLPADVVTAIRRVRHAALLLMQQIDTRLDQTR